MLMQSLSDLFFGGGCVILPDAAHSRIADLDREEIIQLFERHGVLLLRGFELAGDEIVAFTNRYTEAYAVDAGRRAARFGSDVVRNVDGGSFAVPLHSEASFGAVWPEIVWFYCCAPSTTGGHTTLCDGMKLWSELPAAMQTLFLAQPLKYHVCFPLDRSQAKGRKVPWPFQIPGVSGFIDRSAGTIVITVVRSAVQESRIQLAVVPTCSRLAFVNHLMMSWEPLVTTVEMADGSPIASDTLDTIGSIADTLTYELHWQPQDLLMIDNRRFLHGRRCYRDGDARDIVQIQSARASFAYGSTTRQEVPAGR